MSSSLRTAASGEDRLRWVHAWSIEAPAPTSNDGSIVCRLTKECISMFKHLLKQISKDPASSACAYQKYDKSCSSLILWEQDYGITKGDLDDMVIKSKSLRISILESLISIGKTLTGKIIVMLNQADDMSQFREALTLVLHEAEICIQNDYEETSLLSDGDSDASSSISDGWLEIANDIWTDVQCLLDLQPIIETPVLTIAATSKLNEPHLAKLKPHTAYTDKISNRYPEADPKLIERLARANWVRFLETKSSRDRNLSLGWIPNANDGLNQRIKTSISEHPSTFHDSGVGSSVLSSSTYAETVMSYHQSERESVRVPPLPEGAKNGIPFDCIACGKNMVIRTNKLWKKHLYSDLHPWMCLDLKCNFGETAFEKREDWIEHLALDHKLAHHWRGFPCPLCHEALDDGQRAITRHLSSHMEEISLSAIPAAAESDHDSDSTSSESSNETKPIGGALRSLGSFKSPINVDSIELDYIRKRKKITHEQWEAKRPIIADLYVRRKMTLSQVMNRLESYYGFTATESQYRARIMKWNLARKRMTPRRLGRGDESSSSLSSDDNYPIRHEEKKHEGRMSKKSFNVSRDFAEVQSQEEAVGDDTYKCLGHDMTTKLNRLTTEGSDQHKKAGEDISRNENLKLTQSLEMGDKEISKARSLSDVSKVLGSGSLSGQPCLEAEKLPAKVPK